MRSTANSRNSRERGFTLLELLIVTVVLAIILGISARTYLGARNRARQNATLSDMRTLCTAVESYMIDFSYPPPLKTDFRDVAVTLKPYNNNLHAPARDHWGHIYRYEWSRYGDYTIMSLGKDGIDGKDITLDTRNDFDRDIILSNGQFKTWPGEMVAGQASAAGAESPSGFPPSPDATDRKRGIGLDP